MGSTLIDGRERCQSTCARGTHNGAPPAFPSPLTRSADAEHAGDATDLSARRKPKEAAQEEIDEGLPQASGGRKEYKDDEGKVTKVVEWFGFKLHLLVDVKHEVVLSYEITDTKAGDGETLPVLLDQAKSNLPEGRIKTIAYVERPTVRTCTSCSLAKGSPR